MELKEFGQLLSQQPSEQEVQTRNGLKYLPISFIENKLDEIFGFACWSYEMRDVTIVANEVCAIVDLKVFHPIAKTWITRSGAAGVQILQDAGASVTDISAKKKNALEMGFPHLKSDALKNAAKSLGVVFGRDLTRKHSDVFSESDSLPDAIKLLSEVSSLADFEIVKQEINLKNPVLKSIAIAKHSEILKNIPQIEEGKND